MLGRTLETTAPYMTPPQPATRPKEGAEACVRFGRAPGSAEAGLATLEWLLIVAAVAGLAALAVVLAQRVVDETAEEVATSSARLTAAMIAAEQVEDDARAAFDAGDARVASWGRWERHFVSRCRRLAITYADAGAEVAVSFARPTGSGDGDPVDPAALAGAGEQPADSSTAQVECGIVDATVPALPVGPPGDPPPPPLDLHDAQQAAADLEAEARRLRAGDNWDAWEDHFGPRCSDIAVTYASVGVRVIAEFNGPTNKQGTDPVTQALLDAATANGADADRPQLRCSVELAR